MSSKRTMQELRNLSEAEMDEKLTALRRNLLDGRFKAAVGRLEKPSQVRKARKDIARILTMKKELSAKKGK